MKLRIIALAILLLSTKLVENPLKPPQIIDCTCLFSDGKYVFLDLVSYVPAPESGSREYRADILSAYKEEMLRRTSTAPIGAKSRTEYLYSRDADGLRPTT